MKNITKTIIFISVLAVVLFTSTDTVAGKKNKGKKADSEAKATFKFNKEELYDLERVLIKNYLKENMDMEVEDRLVKIYNVDGGLFFEGKECIIGSTLNDYEFLFEQDSVIYYLKIEDKE